MKILKLNLLVLLLLFVMPSFKNYNNKEVTILFPSEINYYGIDISRYQGNIKWEKLIREEKDLDFVICKATEGEDLRDIKFKLNWDSLAKYSKVKKGAYHFFNPKISGYKQAQNYFSMVKLEPGNILPIVDVEYTKAWRRINRKNAISNLRVLIYEIEKHYNCRVIVYTSSGFWNKYIANYYKIDKNNFLWVADYRKNENPQIPKGFEEHIIWQHTPKGILPGISKYVDRNICKNLNLILLK